MPSRTSPPSIGQPSSYIEAPTRAIPEKCWRRCTWVVIRPGVSRLKYASAACRTDHATLGETP